MMNLKEKRNKAIAKYCRIPLSVAKKKGPIQKYVIVETKGKRLYFFMYSKNKNWVLKAKIKKISCSVPPIYLTNWNK